MSKGIKIWGVICCVSIFIILTPLWATLFAILLGSSVPWLTDLITSVDKFVSILGVLIFIFAVCRFSKLVAKQHQKVLQQPVTYSRKK